MMIRIFKSITLQRIYMFKAHSGCIRSIVIHPTEPFILTSSDDMLIKLWNWEKQWSCTKVFKGHTDCVMQIVINPKDKKTFASASLDRLVKVWKLGSGSPKFSLIGHQKGVNCVDYYHGGDKPYLISGANDRLVKIWDYQNKTCIQTLEGHAQNISAVIFHPEFPIIMTGSEDGTVRIWHAITYCLEFTLNYSLGRVWTIACLKGCNSVALGYDAGSIIIKLGHYEPAMSMDHSGKIIWAKHSELQQAELKAMTEANIKDGERLPLIVKDMGSCEIYPLTISHSPNGRFVVVCDDSEYIIYTTMPLRIKSRGSAQEVVWALDSSKYAVRERSASVKIFKNFKEKKVFKPEYGAEAIFGGHMLGVKSLSGLDFYDWKSFDFIRRIGIQPQHVYWSESENVFCIAADDSFYIRKFNADAVTKTRHAQADASEDIIEFIGIPAETVKTGLWIGDCFIYTNSVNKLNYYVGGEIVTIAHLDRVMYLLGYIPEDNRLYLGDKELNVVSYSLLLSVLEYRTAVMSGNSEVAHVLEKQNEIHLIKKDDKVGASEATLLNMLNVSPDSGTVFSPEILDITSEDLRAKFMEGVMNIASVSLEIGYPTLASVPHSIVNGLKNLIAIAVETDINFKEAEMAKEYLKDPSKFAAAAAAPAATPAADGGGADKKEEAKKEESEE